MSNGGNRDGQRPKRRPMWSSTERKGEVVPALREGDGRVWGRTGNPLCGIPIRPPDNVKRDRRKLPDWDEEETW